MAKSRPIVAEFTKLTFGICRRLGWIPVDDNPTFGEKFYLIAGTIYAFVCIIQEAIWFITNLDGNTDTFLSLTNVAPCMGFVSLAVAKISTIYLNRGKIKRIFKRLEGLCWDSASACEVNGTLKNSLTMMKVLTVDYIILIWMFNLMPLVVIIIHFCIDGTYFKTIPYFLWYPWKVSAPIVYELTYIALMWAGWISAIGILSCDLMFFMLLAFLNMQFNVLGKEIKEIISHKKPGTGLREWINRHNELLDFARDIEGIFSWTILLNFTGSSVIICLVGIQIMVGIEITELVKFFLFLEASMVQIFIICWHGQKLTDSTEAISDEIYNSDWTSINNERLKKDLMFIIMRCQKPVFLTAWKFSQVSLHSYGMILSSAVSYFGFMRNVYDRTSA